MSRTMMILPPWCEKYFKIHNSIGRIVNRTDVFSAFEIYAILGLLEALIILVNITKMEVFTFEHPKLGMISLCLK